MPDSVQLRHHDYLLPIGTVPAGLTVSVKLQLDNDAGFILRGRAVRIGTIVTPVLPNPNQAFLANYFDRFSGPDLEYNADRPMRFQNENGDFGQWGQFLPVRKPVYYPPGGVIQLEVFNNSGVDMTGLEAYFRGSKVYQPGILPCLTYPAGSVSTEPFILTGAVLQLGLSEARLNNFIQARSDSDFIIRAINGGSWSSVSLRGNEAQYFQLYIQLKDAVGKTYSNLPVHMDVCFGSLGSILSPMNLAPSLQLIPSTHGPYHPPLLLPEIYLPAKQLLYYDLYRNDGPIAAIYGLGTSLQPVDVLLAFHGMKVFRQG